MKTKLEHNFQTKAHDLPALFKDVHKFATFISRLEKQSNLDPDRYEPFKYRGDGFEFFVELFLMLHPNDNRVGVYDYHPVQENDNGVDGIGMNINIEKCVVQIKYRSDAMSELTATNDHLSNMFSDGDCNHQVVTDHKNHKNYRHFVFTSATGLHFYTDQEMFKSRVKCIGYQDFRSLLDFNYVFWNRAYEIVCELVKQKS